MAISPCKVPGVQSSVGPPNAPYATGSLDARYPSKSPNALMIEDGITSPAFSPAEVPSMDFGLQHPASAGPQYFALSPRAQLPVSWVILWLWE